jgi:hypothetical protein
MADHTHNALGSMSYALRYVVAPAVDPADPIATEQLQSAVRYLEFLLERLDLLPAFHRADLAQQADLAVALLPASAQLDAALADAITESVRIAQGLLDTPAASIALLRDESATLAELVTEVVRQSESAANDQTRTEVGRTVVAASRRRTLLERAWYLPLGFDQSPDEVPPLEQLIGVEPSHTGQAATP